MKIKTSELTGAALDWVVAKAEGLPLKLDPMGFRVDAPDSILAGWWVCGEQPHMIVGYKRTNRNQHEGYSPSTNWAQGGPIIEREGIDIYCYTLSRAGYGLWLADIVGEVTKVRGASPLIAAMRCYVARSLGPEIEIPDSLGE